MLDILLFICFSDESPPLGFKDVERELRQLMPFLPTSSPKWRQRTSHSEYYSKNSILFREQNQASAFPSQDECKKVTKTCAVVGNSYQMLGSNLGELIDAHDVVIRFNTAPTDSR